MNRPIRLMTAALVASTALLLTACGSGGSDNDTADKVKGPGDGDEKASASAGATSQPDGSKRPEIKLPKSFQVDFTGWKNSDPELQSIMDDGKERLLSSYSAIIKRDPQYDGFTFYNTSDALRTGTTWVKQFTDDNLTLIGKGRVFQPQPRISPDGSGTLFYCVDESKGSTKDRETGEITTTPAKTALVLYRTKLSKTDEGVWKTTMVQTEPGACK
ncbi:hypothetical protein AB0I94_35660 [Streptomyces sp. NPDC050147]|uniref:hypothetical protein n=1 Tax=Streptomyces sp. NPDC050147 TaxID=3155513 RepID=UPI003416BDE0